MRDIALYDELTMSDFTEYGDHDDGGNVEDAQQKQIKQINISRNFRKKLNKYFEGGGKPKTYKELIKNDDLENSNKNFKVGTQSYLFSDADE